MTGITRLRAAEVIAEYFGTTYTGSSYFSVPDRSNRKWSVVNDGSITTQVRDRVHVGNEYAVEMVSPICVYDDIPDIQQLVRNLRRAGAISNSSCGIHIHVNAAPFDARTLRNLTNIMASKEDLIYKALKVHVSRENRYCQKVDHSFLEELNRRKPQNLSEVQRIWYGGYDGSHDHYHHSRYHCLNLHSVFEKGTVEFRLFNSDIRHAGKIKAYIQLSLAICHQALTQRTASRRKTVSTNEKYTFRTWLLRLGLVGDEFKTARMHLLKNLDGNIAWKDPAQAEQQKERFRQKALEQQQNTESNIESEPEPGSDFEMSM